MIGFLLVLGVVAAFAAVNVEHRSNVSLGFATFPDVPIFLSLLFAFIGGALLVMPLALRRGRRMRDAELTGSATEAQLQDALTSGRASGAEAELLDAESEAQIEGALETLPAAPAPILAPPKTAPKKPKRSRKKAAE